MVRAAPAPVREEVLVRVRAREQRELRHPEEVRVRRERQVPEGLCEARQREAHAAEVGGAALGYH